MKTQGTLARAVVLSLATILALAILPTAAHAQTVGIVGSEATGLTRTVDGDGSVRVVAVAFFNGLVGSDAGLRAVGAAQFTLTVVQAGDVLETATIAYTQAGRRGGSVTVEINPCFFELSNEPDYTSADFGADIREKVEAALGTGPLDPAVKTWLEQRIASLSARIVEPNLKAGIVIVPPRG